MLRNPQKKEYNKCAELIQISGPELFKYIYNESDEKMILLMESFISFPKTTFSHDKIIINEDNGSVRGLILAHPVKDLNKFIISEIKCINKFRGGFFKSFIHILGMFSRLGFVSKYPKLNKDEYFISNLAVFKKHRGKGISKQLLDRVIQDANEKGFTKVSLYVEIDNDVAYKVYNKYGFKEKEKAVFPKKYNKYGLYGFCKMIKEI